MIPVDRCEFVPTEFPGRYRCVKCGFLSPVTRHPPERIYRTCGLGGPPVWRPAGLGDTVAWLIKRLTFGKLKESRRCRCSERRAWLNRLVPYGHDWRWWWRRLAGRPWPGKRWKGRRRGR